jgi:1-acylglycerone phosphate reductase
VPNFTVLTPDVLSSNSIPVAVKTDKKISGKRLEISIDNSSGGSITPGLDDSIEQAKKWFDLDFWASSLILRAFEPLLMKAKGYITKNSSANAYIPIEFISKCSIPLQLFTN